MIVRKLLIYFILIVSVFSCKKVDKWTQFDMAYETTVTISSSTGVNLPFNIITPDITTNSESTFELNNTRKDLVEKLVLKELKLTITSPSNGNFDFLKSIKIYINSSSLPEAEIASKLDIQDGVGNVVLLNTSSSDIKEYIKADKFSLRLETTTDELLTVDYDVKVNAVFFVDAKILGQ